MPLYAEKRKIIETGKGSLIVTLPKIWTRAHDVKAGDEVELQFDGFDGLLVKPIKLANDLK